MLAATAAGESAYGHEAGRPLECLSIAVELRKETAVDEMSQPVLRVGFKIGGGIDQDPERAPFVYPDTVNGNDFTMVTHDKAVKYIKQYPVLHMLVARRPLPL